MKHWLKAIRLRTIPLALASIVMGSFLAAETGNFNLSIFSFAVITTVFLQILSNLANDYGDSIHGADSIHRTGPARSVQSGSITAKSMKLAIILVSFLSFVSGIILLYLSFSNLNFYFVLFILLGTGAIMAALGYTLGKRPYGYSGLGDLFVMIFFGLVGVLGTLFLFTGKVDIIQLLPALSTGFFATAVLNINNIRDLVSDREAGKKSIPVRIGRKKAVWYHWFLLSAGFISALLYTFLDYHSMMQLMFIITLPLFIINGRDVYFKTESMQLDPSLRKMAITSLLFSLTFGAGLII